MQVRGELAAGQAALDSAQAQAAQLQQQVAGLAQSLEEEQAARALAVREAAEKGSKLAQLEGEGSSSSVWLGGTDKPLF